MKKEIFRFIVFIAIAIIIKCVILFKIMTMGDFVVFGLAMLFSKDIINEISNEK